MGAFHSKKPKLEINDVDRAVLTLKSQVRKLEQQRSRIHADIDRQQQVARDLVRAGKKDRALLALRKRKLQEASAARLDAFLLNVEEMLSNIETTKNQQRIFAALKEGNNAVKQMQQETPLEDVEKLMQDSADAKAYVDSLNQMLGESLAPEEEAAAEAELLELERQELDARRLEMPQAPATQLPAAAAAEAEQPEAGAAAEQQEAALAELPSVPQTKVRPPAAAAMEEVGVEPERVLVAA